MRFSRLGFSGAFYLTTLMELFERLAWYGFFTVSSLYMTASPERGGLGFSNTQRGVLQGIIPFFVYLLPVFMGAIADRVGYRPMFLGAFIVLAPAYWLLGEARGFWAFFAAYMLVALGAATFKPLVVGTVARVTTQANRGVGFGIFYLMVNVGGFLGPILAGAARGVSWDWVFMLCATAIGVNLLLAWIFFRDPPATPQAGGASLWAALEDAQRVLGNGRFALLVAVLIVILMLAGGAWLSWRDALLLSGLWVVLHLVWDLLATGDRSAPWLRQKLRIGNVPFLAYLLVLSVFWAAYFQIYLTLPLYIRDFVDTSDLARAAAAISSSLVEFLAHVDVAAAAAALSNLAQQYTMTPAGTLESAARELAELQILLPEHVLAEGLRQIANGASATEVASNWAREYRQVNPEYIISLDFLSIVLFQYWVSRAAAHARVFKVLVGGTLLISLSYGLGGFAHLLPMAGFAAAGMVVLFAFGEMLASPKSQEYVAAVAPPSSAALFMGYYFVSSALGLLLAGVLSGSGYERLAIEHRTPELMWAVFAGVAMLAALALYLFNIYMAPRFALGIHAPASAASAGECM